MPTHASSFNALGSDELASLSPIMTYAELLRAATTQLAGRSPTAKLDAELLLAAACGTDRIHLLAESATSVPPGDEQRFRELVERRAAGEPVAYLLGEKEFYGRSFIVDRRVLIPRPETELLIERALAHMRDRAAPVRIADIGTGSACIAITLALELPQAAVIAIDLSPDALAVARLNIARYGLADRVELLAGDGLEPLQGPVDLLVSNPPYMTLDRVADDVRHWEPHIALEGRGPDGAELPRRLLAAAPDHLAPGGALFMEIADWQGAAVFRLARAIFPAAMVRIHQDLAGQDRLLAVET